MRGRTVVLAAIALVMARDGAAAPWSVSCGTPAAETVSDLAPLPDGDFAVVGRAAPLRDSAGDLLVMRLGPLGEMRWARTYGGALDDGGLGIVGLSDGTLVVAGYSFSFGSGGSDLWLLALSGAGDVLWERVLGERAGSGFGDMARLADDRVALVSRTEGPGGLRLTNGWIVLVDAGGRIAQSTWGGDGDESLARVAALADGGAIVAAFRPPQDHVLLRLLPDGSLAWQSTLLPAWALRSVRALAATSDGGGLVLAESPWGPDSVEIVVAKVDSDGTVAWARRSATESQGPFAVLERGDGRIVLAATIVGASADQDILLAELDPSGALLRQQVLGGPGDERGGAVGELGSGGGLVELLGGDLLVAGTTAAEPDGLPDAWAARIPDDWSASSCARRDDGGLRLLDLALEGEQRAGELARPSAQPSRTECVVTEWTVVVGSPCPPPCGTVVAGELSGAPWLDPLLVRDRGLLTWADARGTCETYGVHRGLVSALRSGDRGACLASRLTLPTHRDDELPGVGAAWFYLVTIVSDAGEGPLGFDSFGRPRVNATPCP